MAFISKEMIDEIKNKNDIVDVIGSYITLNDKNKALCPFHDDHTPSFSIQSDKQIYKCFSCGESGNVITFVQKYNNISFIESLKILSDRAGIKLDVQIPKKRNIEYDNYYEINDTVNRYFKNNLNSTSGKYAMKYLLDRNISKELIKEFSLGLSTSNNLSILLSKKYNMDLLTELDIVKEINGKYYDTFQSRIIFPIFDEENNVIGFSGRKYLSDDLKDETQPKYSNTKETKLFIKSSILYNINNALPFIKKKHEIIITEGFMDTIRISSIGYKNVIALMGTAFTKDHLEKIIKMKCKVVLNLDQDNAGVLSTISIGEELVKNNIETSVIIFDDFKDSDDFINKKGKESFDIAYNNKISFIDFKLKHLRSDKNMKDSVDISKFINEAIESLNMIDDDVLKELKTKELAKEFDIDESVIKNKLKGTKSIEKPIIKQEEVKRYNKYDISEIRILYLMINYDDVILYFENSLGYLIHDNMSQLAYKIIEFRNDYGYFNYSDFIDYISDAEELNKTLKEVMKYHHNEEYTLDELEDYINTVKEFSIKRRIESLKREMNSTLDINKKIEIAKKIENINKEVLKW
ncbi:MAG: DNA primase [Tenericutes bacterium]|nr:DNA primase [Mycoplasmatota bacterium]